MMIKEVLNDKGEKINNPEEWKHKAPPMRPIQWQDGRSAKTNAEYVFSDHKELDELLKLYTKYEKCILYAEKKTELDPLGKRGPRNHDSLMVFDDLVVGVEAKVDESLDNKIKQYDLNKERYSGIIKMIYGDNVDMDIVREMYYQLLSGTYGTFVEAKNRGKDKALFLIITYITNRLEEKKLEINKKAIEEFIDSIPSDGDKKVLACNNNNIDFYIKHITIDLTKKG